MSVITQTRKVIVEQFPKQKDWIAPLLNVFNNFVFDVVRAVNGNIEFGLNIMGVENEFVFTYQSHSASLPVEFSWPLLKKPRSLVVASAFENDPSVNRSFIPVMVSVSWDFSAKNTVRLLDVVKFSGNSASISDLSVGKKYKILVRVTP